MATSFRVVVLKEGDNAESLQSVVCSRVKAIFSLTDFYDKIVLPFTLWRAQYTVLKGTVSLRKVRVFYHMRC